MAVSSQIDWISLSCLTSKTIDVISFLEKLLDTLYLRKLWDNGDFIYVGRDKYYACVYRYNDISICLCHNSLEQLIKQGIAIKFTSNGLAFYQEHLEKHFKTDLRTVCRRWRSLCCDGFFTRCTRFDFAVDDKCTPDKEPLLTMRRVRQSLKRHEFTSLLTTSRSPEGEKIPVSYDTSAKASELIGNTVYLGKRKGGSVVVRFYDKFLEQKSLNNTVDDDISSWVRSEIELHNNRAMSAFNVFCDNDTKSFKVYMLEVLNNYVSFIYRTDKNVSRCPIKRWWKEFLSTAKKSSLVTPPYKPTSFIKTEHWLEKSIFPTLSRYVKCIGLDRFLKKLGEFLDKPVSPRINQMEADYKTMQDYDYSKLLFSKISDDEYIKQRGFDPWLLTGSVSFEDIKQDFVSFGDFSPTALSFAGEQLVLTEGYFDSV